MNLILSENASASSVFAVEEARFPILPRIFERSERRAVDERPTTSGETNAKPGRADRVDAKNEGGPTDVEPLR